MGKVKYKTVEEINDIIISKADNLLDELKNLRKWIIDNLHCDDSKQEEYMIFFFIQMLNMVLWIHYSTKMYHFKRKMNGECF